MRATIANSFKTFSTKAMHLFQKALKCLGTVVTCDSFSVQHEHTISSEKFHSSITSVKRIK